SADGEAERYPDLVVEALRGKRLATLDAIRWSIAKLPASVSEKRFFVLALLSIIPRFSRAVAKIVKFESTPQQAVAVVDLTQAYQPHVDLAVRTFTLEDRKRLVVTDELHARQPAELWWFLHTEAKVSLGDHGRTASLSQHGKTFTVRLQEPVDAEFEVMDCRPLPTSPNPEPQADNRNRRKLALHLDDVRDVRIRVSLE
ncbi:MAG TPA: hypothetical protein VMY37_34665, partial [Thermoguttaceae bacterium]|nr:hypothetical protein [Thermoguttaceae bacterium]